ncbi:S1C family serine protease [Nitrospirota bacterium]
MRKIQVSVIFAALAFILLMVPEAFSFPAVEVYKEKSPAVVLIVASSGSGSSQMGAGSVITRDGLIITNAHVVMDSKNRPFRKVSVYTRPEEISGNFDKDLRHRHKVSVIDYDRDLDLALLKVGGLGAETGVIDLADPMEVMVGAEVVAIGHPEQGGLWSLTYGRISGQLSDQGKVRGKDVYQTDTSVNKGNSGGPLLDGRGRMVGVNTNIARRGAGNLAITGVNFALKSSVVNKWLKQSQGISLAYGGGGEGTAMVASARQEQEAGVQKDDKQADMEEPRRTPDRKTMKETDDLDAPDFREETAKKTVRPPKDELSENKPKSDTILTPPKPYRTEDLYKAVEKEMEDMMKDMKEKFRRKKH